MARNGKEPPKEPPSGPDIRPTPSYELSDDHLAEDFAERYGAAFCYSDARKTWRVYDGVRWIDDTLLHLQAELRGFFKQIAPSVTVKLRDRCGLRSAKRLGAVERMLRSMLAVEEMIFDADPWLLNCPGGTWNLRQGALFESHTHAREDYLSKITGVDPEGDYTKWLSFINFITVNDTELADYLQRLAGYSLVGDTSEQMLAFFYGTGGNGKGTFLRMLLHVLGDYGATCDSEVFMASPFLRHSEEVMALRGARLVVTSEVDASAKWNEARLKSWTGGDKFRARYLHENSVEFVPQATLIFPGNDKPELRGVDQAIKRRFHIVPFKAEISERDGKYEEELKKEAGGILRWMIEGCRKWQSGGLPKVKAITIATDDYLTDEDPFQQWLNECCTVADKNHGTSIAILFASWKRWAEDHGLKCGSTKTLSQRLAKKGYERDRSSSTRSFSGIKLNDAPALPQTQPGADESLFDGCE